MKSMNKQQLLELFPFDEFTEATKFFRKSGIKVVEFASAITELVSEGKLKRVYTLVRDGMYVGEFFDTPNKFIIDNNEDCDILPLFKRVV